MDQPLVSIIIPAYNSEKYLAETITAALDQTWPNKEVIIVDDGSTDGTLAIARKFESETVQVFYQENKGASGARNKGLQEAKGQFIQFLDGDDLLSPDKITIQMDVLLQNPGKIAACGTVHFMDGTPHEQGTPTPDEDDFLFSDDDPAHFLINFLGGFKDIRPIISVHAWLTPKTIIDKAGKWNEELTVDDDGEFFSRVILNSAGIIKTGGISYYRKFDNSNNSLSSQQNKTAFESIYRSISSKEKNLSAYSHSPAMQIAINKQFTGLAVMTYLKFPDIYKLADEGAKRYPGYKFTPVMGGKLINFFAKIFGWKVARRIQLLLNK
jgi:glycosyltransferase involved in cell wall biosynthesis